MLFDGLLALDLPVVEDPPVAAPFWEGLERLLFDGHWRRRPRRVSLSTAAVLSGCYVALRPLTTGPIQVMDDAGELFSVEVAPADFGEAPPPWAEILPPEWGRVPSAFAMACRIEEGDFASTLRLRYVPEPPDHQAPLVGAYRVAWRPKGEVPEAGLEPVFLEGLREVLRLEGEGVGRLLLERLSGLGAGEVRGTTRVLHLPEDARFRELLRDFPEESRRTVVRLSEWAALSGRWAALAPEGVAGELSAGRFVAGGATEVALAL